MAREPRSEGAGGGRRRTPAGRGSAGGRAAWGSISRDDIVDAALRVVERDDLDGLTIRGLSADLGVAPMSLYRHVRDKDDLLDEVAERLLADVWIPEAPEDDWRAWTAEAAERLRALLVGQPAVLRAYLRHPVVSPSALDRMARMLGVLERAGFDRAAAERAYAAVQTYTIGFGALEASREGWDPSGTGVDPVAQRLAAYTTPRQFAAGLAYLLDGIEAYERPGRSA